MTVLYVILGAVAGYMLDFEFLRHSQALVEPVIYLMIFVSGLGIGYSLRKRRPEKKLLFHIITTPVFSVIGSLLGGVLFGRFIGYDLWQSCLLSSGMGWYSLTSVMISKYDVTLGLLSLMINLFREMLALMLTPAVAKYIGYLEAVTPGGATCMDTTLGVISASTDENTTIVAFSTGTILMIAVPAMTEFFLGMNFR